MVGGDGTVATGGGGLRLVPARRVRRVGGLRDHFGRGGEKSGREGGGRQDRGDFSEFHEGLRYPLIPDVTTLRMK